MKCFYCDNKMEQIITTYVSKWGTYEVAIRGVKAYKCTTCNDLVLDHSEVKMIQDLTESFSEKTAPERPNENECLNVQEVADLLRVSNQTIYNMIRDGRLKATKAGREWRFSRQEIEEILSPPALAARGSLSKKDAAFINSLFKK